ncbi:MAG TPA: PEGA domain-containing protein [Polyangiales bacterium]|nr:PEGA domain-containing protein [Polyangiales bacterium]
MTRWLATGVGLLLASWVAVPQALAQDEPADAEVGADSLDPVTVEARAHFQKGVDFYAEGDLNAARVELERAYALQPTYRLLFNLGQVAYEQREYAAAERYFRDYLEQGGDDVDDTRRREVERELGRLRGRVANVQITTNVATAKLFVDGREVGTAPMNEPVRLSAGRRLLRAEAPGHSPVSREVDVVGGEDRRFELRFGPDLRNDARSTEASDPGPHPALWTGIATGVLALGAGGMAFWAGVDDRAYDDELEHRTSRGELDSIEDRTKTKALIADVLLGTAVAGAAATLVLLLTVDHPGGDESADSASRWVIGPGSVRASF